MVRKPVHLAVLLLSLALCAVAASPVPAGAALSCSDCINLCLLRHCGFSEPPACVAQWSGTCHTQCVAQGSC